MRAQKNNQHYCQFNAFIIASCCLFLIIGCNGQQSKPIPAQTVSTVTLSQSTIPITKTYIGITQSIASVNIRARVKGFLTKMNFVEGTVVEKGRLLFVIDPKPFEAKLDLVQGQLSRSIAVKEYEAVQYLRLKQLVGQGDISKSDFDKAAASYRKAEADVQIHNAEVEDAQINLSYCRMYAPFEGLIGKRYVDVGNLVGGTEETLLATILKLDPIYVQFSPSVTDVADFSKFQKNSPFTVEVKISGEKEFIFKGKIDLTNNQADVATSTILMRAVIDNPKKLLLPGVYVNITLFLSPESKVILVPQKAVLQTQGEYSVYLAKDGKVVSRRLLVSGEYRDSYIVKSGVVVGDQVITNALQKIRPGQLVNINND